MLSPSWPGWVLAAIQVADGVACAIPIEPIRVSLDRVQCPPGVRRVLPLIKVASAIGLVAGLWFQPLGVATAAALILYFVLAVAAHVRVRDDLIHTAPAVGMGAATVAVLVTTYL